MLRVRGSSLKVIMQRSLFCFLVTVVFLSACRSVPIVPPLQTEPVIPPKVTEVPTERTEPAVRTEPKEPIKPPDSSRIIDITTRNWAFSPANISVRKGEKVTLRIIGEEGVHGFAVPELSINKTIRLGEVITVDLPTGTAGLYRFFCSVQCGQGHIDMNGEIIIEP